MICFSLSFIERTLLIKNIDHRHTMVLMNMILGFWNRSNFIDADDALYTLSYRMILCIDLV